ncbi:MAG: aldo/keto reductase, partial [Rhodospirillales bacterium]|nr:aldo/keto reductase [Rhodospirillales bacterium]
LGCAGMSKAYGKPDDAQSIATLEYALERGITLLDTSDAYGNGKNEELICTAIKDNRHKVVIASKFGNIRPPGGGRAENGRPDYVPQACEASLRRLGTDVIDLYYLHRVDPKVPIEDTVGAMARLVEEGKVRYLGLSEAGPETLRRAHATHPLTAIQTELSLWSRDSEREILPLCRELGIGYVAYAPLGRGFLTGTIRVPEDLQNGDRRHDHPRFYRENLEKNNVLLMSLDVLAEAKGCTPAQIALAWVLAQGEDIVPIPGTKRSHILDENIAAVELTLTAKELEQLDRAFAPGSAAGSRYPDEIMHRLGR